AATAAVPATRLRTATTASGARLLKRRIGLPLPDGSAPAPEGAEPGAAAVIGRSPGAEERFSGRWTRAPHPTARRTRRSDLKQAAGYPRTGTRWAHNPRADMLHAGIILNLVKTARKRGGYGGRVAVTPRNAVSAPYPPQASAARSAAAGAVPAAW